MFYYRGLKEWNNEKGYLTDTCLTAQDFTVNSTTTQADVDTVVAALEQASSKLVVSSDSTEMIEVAKLAVSTPVGKQIALKITTTPNV